MKYDSGLHKNDTTVATLSGFPTGASSENPSPYDKLNYCYVRTSEWKEEVPYSQPCPSHLGGVQSEVGERLYEIQYVRGRDAFA